MDLVVAALVSYNAARPSHEVSSDDRFDRFRATLRDVFGPDSDVVHEVEAFVGKPVGPVLRMRQALARASSAEISQVLIAAQKLQSSVGGRAPADQRQQIAVGNYIAQAQDQGTAILTVHQAFQATEPKSFGSKEIVGTERCLVEALARGIPSPGSLPDCSRMAFNRNPLFVGRESELDQLARRLGGEAQSPVAVTAVTGLGGVGKTQLAVEFAHRVGRFFAGGVFWLSFANPTDVPSEIAACAPGVLTLGSNFPEMPLATVVQFVRQALQSAIPRLLVFDNCEDEQVLQQWRPSTGGCRVLITCRRAMWDTSTGIRSMPLPEFAKNESVALLHLHRSDVPTENQMLGAIAEELGNLPLAVHLAGSFLARYRHTRAGDPDGYLDQLREHRLFEHRSFDAQTLSPTGHDHSLARTFELSRAQLSADGDLDRLGLALLDRVCFFAGGEPIPRALLLASIADDMDELDADDALVRLGNLGLINIETEGSLRVHRLVAAYARGMVTDVGAQEAVETTLLMAFRQLREGARVLLARSLQPHLVAAVARAQPRGDGLAALLCNAAGNHFRLDHQYVTALRYLEQALEIHEDPPDGDMAGLPVAINDLGLVVALAGDHERAEALYQRAIPLWRERRDWPNLAATFDNLAQSLSHRRIFGEARKHFRLALKLRERTLGPSDARTAITLNNLGQLMLSQGDFASAAAYDRRALAIREQVLDPEHPHLAASLLNLGMSLLYLGEAGPARDLVQRAIEIREKVLGPKHPGTIGAKHAMGAILLVLGDNASAEACLRQTIEGGNEQTGPAYRSVGTTLNNLGISMWQQGYYVNARRFYERALQMDANAVCAPSSDVPGTDGLDIVLLNNLAMLLAAQGESSNARVTYEKALALQAVVGQDGSPLTARICHNLGALLCAHGDFAEARRLLEKALDIRTRTLGERSRDTAMTTCVLGRLAADEGDPAVGRRLIEEALSILRELPGGQHADVARCLHELGVVCALQSDTTGAVRAMSEASKIREQLYPHGHPDTAATEQALGRLARDAGDVSGANAHFERAVAIARLRLGEAHDLTRSIVEDLARLAIAAGQ